MEKFHAFRFLQESKKVKDKGNKKKRKKKKKRKIDNKGVVGEISLGIKQAIDHASGKIDAKETTLSTGHNNTTQTSARK